MFHVKHETTNSSINKITTKYNVSRETLPQEVVEIYLSFWYSEMH